MALEHESDTAIARAVRAAGSQSALGRFIGKRQSTIRDWLVRGVVPAEFVQVVEVATGIEKEELRPDLFGQPEAPPPSDRYNGERA